MQEFKNDMKNKTVEGTRNKILFNH